MVKRGDKRKGDGSKVVLRLYRRHDIDLLALYKNKNFNFQAVVRDAVRAYVRGETYLMYAPEAADYCNFNFKYMYQVFIKFDPIADKDIIDYLDKNVKSGMAAAFVKTIVRGCIVGASAYVCSKDENGVEKSNNLYKAIRLEAPSLLEPPKHRKDRVSKKKTAEKPIAKEQPKKDDTKNAPTVDLTDFGDDEVVAEVEEAPSVDMNDGEDLSASDFFAALGNMTNNFK